MPPRSGRTTRSSSPAKSLRTSTSLAPFGGITTHPLEHISHIRNAARPVSSLSGSDCDVSEGQNRYEHRPGHDVWDWLASLQDMQRPLNASFSSVDAITGMQSDSRHYASSSTSSVSYQYSANISCSPALSFIDLDVRALSPMPFPSSLSDYALGEDDIYDTRPDDEYFFENPGRRLCRSTGRSTGAPADPTTPPRPAPLSDPVLRALLEHWPEVDRCENDGGSSDRVLRDTNELPNYHPHSSTSPSPRTFAAGYRPFGISGVVDHSLCALISRQCSIAGAEGEQDRQMSPSRPDLSEKLDILDPWITPPLYTSSSSSAEESFNLDLFSPIPERSESVRVWDESRSSQAESSPSAGYYSSSPFIGWTSSSAKGFELALQPKGDAPTTYQPLTLHQPQPIRPIPPIPIPLLDNAQDSDDDIDNPSSFAHTTTHGRSKTAY